MNNSVEGIFKFVSSFSYDQGDDVDLTLFGAERAINIFDSFTDNDDNNQEFDAFVNNRLIHVSQVSSSILRVLPDLRPFLHTNEMLPIISVSKAIIFSVYISFMKYTSNIVPNWKMGAECVLSRGFILGNLSPGVFRHKIMKTGRTIALAAKKISKEELYCYNELSPKQWNSVLKFAATL